MGVQPVTLRCVHSASLLFHYFPFFPTVSERGCCTVCSLAPLWRAWFTMKFNTIRHHIGVSTTDRVRGWALYSVQSCPTMEGSVFNEIPHHKTPHRCSNTE